MPTGYTSAIYEGKKEVTLKDFVLTCARAFGANIEMRDEPLSSDIKKYEVSNYYSEQIEVHQKELAELEAMTNDEIVEYNKKQYNKLYEEYVEKQIKNTSLLNRYNDMLTKVRAWEPPSPEHISLKNFMISQLEESIRCDGYTSDPPEMSDYYTTAIKLTKYFINYYSGEHKKEVNRINQRNKWNDMLKESLANI